MKINKKISYIKRVKIQIMSLAIILTALIGFSSCSAVFDDLQECPRGVIMKFVFDYNLERINSFSSQVDCLTIFLFDADGNLVERRTETTDVLKDENWRMIFDLPAGEYIAVAYGGMECEKASFSTILKSEDIKTIEDLEVLTNPDHIGSHENPPTTHLHDHFHGYLKFMVHEGTDYDHEKMKMMRNTNHLRIVLQHQNNTPVDHNDFKFEVIDDNTKFDHKNNIIPNQEITYTPWARGNAIAGINGLPESANSEDTKAPGDPVQVAYAEFSLSRLIAQSHLKWISDTDKEVCTGPRLRIVNKTDGRIVADIPLNNYLLIMKSDYYSDMSSQEYLDRAYQHNMIFFLDENNYWVKMNIHVMDYNVIVNNIKY